MSLPGLGVRYEAMKGRARFQGDSLVLDNVALRGGGRIAGHHRVGSPGGPGPSGAQPRVPGQRLQGDRREQISQRDGRQPGAVRQGDGLHAHRVAADDGAPVLGFVGLSGDRVLSRRPAGSARPTTSVFDRHCHQRRASASSSIGCRRTFRRMRTGCASSTAPRSTSTPIRARASISDWGTLIFNYGRNEVRNFLICERAVLARRSTTSTGCAWMLSPRCSISITRARQGEWVPNRYGGNENLEAISFLCAFNEVVHSEVPGVDHDRRGIDRWPGVSAPTYLDGLGFTLQVEHGMDARHARHYFEPGSDLSPVSSQAISRSRMLYAFTENFVLPISHDEVVHGKRSLLDKMPGDTWQKFANLRALYAYMLTHPGKKLLFMGGEFGQWREWNHDEGLPWSVVDEPPHAASAVSCATSTRSITTNRRCIRSISSPAASTGSTAPTTRTASSRSSAARDGASEVIVVLNFTPIVPRSLRDRRAGARPLPRADQHRRRNLRRRQRRQRRPDRNPPRAQTRPRADARSHASAARRADPRQRRVADSRADSCGSVTTKVAPRSTPALAALSPPPCSSAS